MVVFHANSQWFQANITRDMLQPNSPNTRKCQQADDKHAMLNDDLKIAKQSKTETKTNKNKKNIC